MAYAAVTSLKHTMQRLATSSRISTASPSLEMLDPAYAEVWSLQKALGRLDKSRNSSKRMKALEGEITEAVCKLEDVLESHVLNQCLSQSESHEGETNRLRFSIDLQELRQDTECFTEAAKKMWEDYLKELDNSLPEEEEDDADVSSRTDFGGKKSKVVGLSHYFCWLRDDLVGRNASGPVLIVGMAGIGKTTLARRIFEDPLISRNFECCAFVTMGQKYQLREIMQAILAQVNPNNGEMLIEGDENLDFHKSLNGKRYFIVLDDVWDIDFWDEFKRRLPEEDNKSRILVTTRLRQVATSINSDFMISLPFLNEEESWDLLCGKVFAEEFCPPQLEKAGKKIAENCEGLPLLILTVADLLSKVEKTTEYWNMVATDNENSVFMDAYDQILKVLYPSYNYLPQHLKACFLYMGAFPQNYDIRPSKLVNLWSAEGFLETEFPFRCFEELVSSNLVVARQKSYYSGIVKACSLHCVYRHLCRKEARNSKFLHILNSYTDGLAKDIKSQRRLSICKNILFGIKDVYNSMASILSVRSLLCTGPYHQYQVPICFGLRLLRVLDALAIRFYDFPYDRLNT